MPLAMPRSCFSALPKAIVVCRDYCFDKVFVVD
jgi:hypothetical protein